MYRKNAKGAVSAMEKVEKPPKIKLIKNAFDVKRGSPSERTVKSTKTPSELRKLKLTLISISFLLRVSSVIFVQSQFVPDEDWQSTEVAHKFIFGFGHLTWEWNVGLRSYLYPLFVSLPYKILQFLGLDYTQNLMLGPKLLQAIMTATGESFFFLYCIRRYGAESTKWIAFTSLSCWFFYYCSSRTITNTTEMALNMISWYFLDTLNLYAFTSVVALNFAIRPTAIVIWIPLTVKIFNYMFRTPKVFLRCLLIGLAVLLINTGIDYLFYGKLVFTWWKFFMFNFVEGHSAQFGVHPFFWYFYNGIPSIIGMNTFVLLAIVLLYKERHKEDIQIVLFYVLIFSLISHKEIRFMLPVLPTIFALIGDYSCLLTNYKVSNKIIKKFIYVGMTVSLLSNIFIVIFFSRFHQVGIKPGTEFINNQIEENNLKNPNIWVLMPCYSIPAYTYIHKEDAEIKFFTCGPNLEIVKQQSNFLEEDFSQFDITNFVKKEVLRGNIPDYIMVYSHNRDDTISALAKYAGTERFRLCARFFHTPAPFDNIGDWVEIICQNYL